jgi:hypothetical protein
MRPLLARFSEPVLSGHLPSWADFITTTPELKFSVHTGFREDLIRQSPDSIYLYEASLATARSGDDQEGPFFDYLRSLFVKRQLDLVAAIGAPAVNFVQRHRQQLFPSIPAVYLGLEQRRVSYATLTPNDSVIAIANDYSAVVENILQVLPETADVVIVIGNSPIEKYWAGQLRIAFRALESRVKFTWFSELSFEEMLKRAAALPPRTAIFFALLSVDAAGVPHEEGKALLRLRAAANAPIFSDVFFGRGIVGGPLNSVSSLTGQAANVAVRIMGGEEPNRIKTPAIGFSTPKYDWRELQRWNISESRLPAGSEVYFRIPESGSSIARRWLLVWPCCCFRPGLFPGCWSNGGGGISPKRRP